MTPHYKDWTYKGSHRLAQTATKLFKNRRQRCRLSPLILMTDPQRLLNPVENAKTLPRGSAIIYRHFGKEDRVQEAKALRRVTFERSQQLLIGHDPELATLVGADGVHFRRDCDPALPALWRKRCPEWIITKAGLKSSEIFKQSTSALDALFVSSIFESHSPSAGEPIGTDKLTQICRKLDAPIIALGGITGVNAAALETTGAAGLAGISGF